MVPALTCLSSVLHPFFLPSFLKLDIAPYFLNPFPPSLLLTPQNSGLCFFYPPLPVFNLSACLSFLLCWPIPYFQCQSQLSPPFLHLFYLFFHSPNSFLCPAIWLWKGLSTLGLSVISSTHVLSFQISFS